MKSTAIGAEKTQKITFISKAHEEFYFKKLEEVRHQDVYHKSLIYCLGMTADTRDHIHRIYDFKTGCVKTECLKEGWQTSGSQKVVRLAFCLYCNGVPSVLIMKIQVISWKNAGNIPLMIYFAAAMPRFSGRPFRSGIQSM